MIIKLNSLKINKLSKENFGFYECRDDLRSIELMYLIKSNKKGTIKGNIKTVQFDSTKLDLLKTQIENIMPNSSVTIECSSIDSRLKFYYSFIKKIFTFETFRIGMVRR